MHKEQIIVLGVLFVLLGACDYFTYANDRKIATILPPTQGVVVHAYAANVKYPTETGEGDLSVTVWTDMLGNVLFAESSLSRGGEGSLPVRQYAWSDVLRQTIVGKNIATLKGGTNVFGESTTNASFGHALSQLHRLY